jgi:hypothetical protein
VPVHKEMTLFDTVMHSIKSHIDSLVEPLSNDGIDNLPMWPSGVGRIGEVNGWLQMPQLNECHSDDSAFLCIKKECSNFGFGSRCHDVAEDDGSHVERAIGGRGMGGWFGEICGAIIEEEMASRPTL